MSVLADFQVNSLNPAKVTTSGTGDVYFPRPNGSLFTAPSTPSVSSAAGQLAYPGESILNGQHAKIVAAGLMTTGTSSTVTITILANTGTVASPAYTTLATFTSGALATTSKSWALTVDVVADSVSKQLSGVFYGVQNNTLVDLTAITATTNPVDPSQTLPFGIVAKVAFGTGNAGNTASLYQLQVLGD